MARQIAMRPCPFWRENRQTAKKRYILR